MRKTCGDRPPNKDSISCTLKVKHREPHTDGHVTWVYYCEECDAVILKNGMCKKCGGASEEGLLLTPL
jgi:rRNA maturation endonuclease Nob1